MNSIQEIKNLTFPYFTNLTKKRIGLPKDGAYILLEELIPKAECVISLGIGDNVEFDLDFISKYPQKIYMADNSIESLPVENERFYFEKLYVNDYTFLEFLKKYNLEENKNMILKIDIEGGEYNTLMDIPEKVLCSFSQICAEFHYLLTNPAQYIDLMRVLSNNFYLFHIHANNIGPIFEGVPETIEVSFVRKDLVNNVSLDKTPCPNKLLDFSNHSSKEDYILDWWC